MNRIVRRMLASTLALSLLVVPTPLSAQEADVVTVELANVGDSTAIGTAMLTANGDATDVELTMTGLTPRSTYGVRMHAGSCEQPSASAAALPDLVADSSGATIGGGALLFQGSEDIALSTIADGEHVLIISAAEPVACGTIPAIESPAPGTLLSGSVPDEGIGLFVFGGGSYEQLLTATDCVSGTARFWATVDGEFVVLVPASRVAAVNTRFDAIFHGSIPSGTALVGTCPRPDPPEVSEPEPLPDGPPTLQAMAGENGGPLGLGSYCWAFAAIRPHVCEDAALTTTAQVLTIERGDSITVVGILSGLESGSAVVFARPGAGTEEGANRISWVTEGSGSEIAVTITGSDLVLTPDLPAGRYLLYLDLQWGLGGAVYGLQFDVR